jgi:hypothetical protein
MKPTCEEPTRAAAFHPILEPTLDDPVVGPLLRRLCIEDADVIAAVADIDRSLIWEALREPPLARLRRSVGNARAIARLRRVAG